jgi:hypothetical protein
MSSVAACPAGSSWHRHTAIAACTASPLLPVTCSRWGGCSRSTATTRQLTAAGSSTRSFLLIYRLLRRWEGCSTATTRRGCTPSQLCSMHSIASLPVARGGDGLPYCHHTRRRCTPSQHLQHAQLLLYRLLKKSRWGGM